MPGSTGTWYSTSSFCCASPRKTLKVAALALAAACVMAGKIPSRRAPREGASGGAMERLAAAALHRAAQRRQQLVRTHGLAHVVVHPRFEALVAVAHHGVSRHRHDLDVTAAHRLAP